MAFDLVVRVEEQRIGYWLACWRRNGHIDTGFTPDASCLCGVDRIS